MVNIFKKTDKSILIVMVLIVVMIGVLLIDTTPEKTVKEEKFTFQDDSKQIDVASQLAKQKEEPRAYEVVGGLLKQLADMNTQLLDLSDKKKKLTTSTQPEPVKTVNNAIFVGSTNELNKMIKSMTQE